MCERSQTTATHTGYSILTGLTHRDLAELYNIYDGEYHEKQNIHAIQSLKLTIGGLIGDAIKGISESHYFDKKMYKQE